jgi:hypothetical protein
VSVVQFARRDATDPGTVARATQRRDGTRQQSPEALAGEVARDPEFLARFVAALHVAAPAAFAAEVPKSALDWSGTVLAVAAPGVAVSICKPSILDSAALAAGIQAAITPELEAYRLSLTFHAPTAELARAALGRAAECVGGLGADRGLVGSVDVRQDGTGWHLYLLAVVGSRDEAQAVKAAALSGLQYLPKAQKLSPLGFGHGATEQDYKAASGYLCKPWAAGVRDLDRDAAAVGSLVVAWAACRATERAERTATRTCACCSAPLPAGSTKRRTFCAKACRQKQHRRDHATQTPSAVPSQSLPAAATESPSSVASLPSADPLAEAAAFVISLFRGEEATQAELHAAVSNLLRHDGVAIPEARHIERALLRALVAGIEVATCS